MTIIPTIRARFAALALLCTLLAGPADAQAPRDALQALSGTYASTGVEAWYGAHGTREFTFRDGQWTLDFRLALDPEMRHQVFRFRTGGPYVVGAPSAAVPGAFEAIFFEDTKRVTLLSTDPEVIAAFGLAGCGLAPGIETDVARQGCAGWRPVDQCREDHDLLALDPDGGLRFGVRPRDNDMCTPARRPTALLPAVRRRD